MLDVYSVTTLFVRSAKMEDRLAREPERLNTILDETRARGYGTRDAIHIGGHHGETPHADGLLAIAVPLLDGAKVHGALDMLWLRTAFGVETFAARHLSDLQTAAFEIVSSLRRRTRA